VRVVIASGTARAFSPDRDLLVLRPVCLLLRGRIAGPLNVRTDLTPLLVGDRPRRDLPLAVLVREAIAEVELVRRDG